MLTPVRAGFGTETRKVLNGKLDQEAAQEDSQAQAQEAAPRESAQEARPVQGLVLRGVSQGAGAYGSISRK
jgi:hypothetical protein